MEKGVYGDEIVQRLHITCVVNSFLPLLKGVAT